VSIHADWMEEVNRLAVGYYRTGASFYDPKTQMISLASGATKKLKSLSLKNANGSISGTAFDMNSNKPIKEGMLMIWAFNEDGFLVKVSGTSEYSGLMTGDYIAPGLRPGTYYLLLWFINSTAEKDEYIWQWYNGTEADVPWALFIPKIDIPAGAYAVIVGNGDTPGIDFYLDRSK